MGILTCIYLKSPFICACQEVAMGFIGRVLASQEPCFGAQGQGYPWGGTAPAPLIMPPSRQGSLCRRTTAPSAGLADGWCSDSFRI